MNHQTVYQKFSLLFPEMATHVDSWFMNGHNSIRIRYANNAEFIFTYESNKSWRLETAKFFLDNGGYNP